MTQVKEIMRHQTFTLSPRDTLIEAAEKMKEHNAGVIVVAEEEEVIGILTDRDIVIRCLAKKRDPRSMRVEEVMSSPVVHCMEDDTLEAVAKKMVDAHVHRLPVMTHSMKLAGLISFRNICSFDYKKGGETASRIM